MSYLNAINKIIRYECGCPKCGYKFIIDEVDWEG